MTSIAISGQLGLGEPSLVFQARTHRAVADFIGVAVFVELEQFGRKEAEPRDLGLLSLRGEWPCNRCTERTEKFAPSHVPPQR